MVFRFVVIVLLVGISACDMGEERELAMLVDRGRIDSVLSGVVERGELVGVSALVYERGEEAYFGVFGMADREAGRPMQRDSLVRIFSMTKPLTGVVLMTFYEQGRFTLDDPLEKYLPEFAGIKVFAGESNGSAELVEPVRPPTIRDILRHTAGFADGDGREPAWLRARYLEADPTNIGNTLQQLTTKLAGVPLLFQPGTRWYYGPSVEIQARLVEVLSGKPYATVLEERVLDPLRMSDTQYTLRAEQRQRIAALYQRDADGRFARIAEHDEYVQFSLKSWPLTPGSWGITSTLDDYMRFARMLLNGGELDGVRILKSETIRLMATDAMPATVTDKLWLPNKGQMGFGIDFAVRVAPPASQAEASGAVGEFFWDGLANTLFWVDPANDITAVLFNIYIPWGTVEIQKDFRDAVYFRNQDASALNKPEPGPNVKRLSD
jgi:CubicO group peptidase (beta-lactamase class C family)